MWQATYEFDCAPGGRPNVKKDAAAAASNQPFLYQLETTQQRYNYFNSKSILDLHKHDVPMALMEAGCSHLSIKIFQYLDSASLLAASLVCLDWQQVLLEWFYALPKFRSKIYGRMFEHRSTLVPTCSKLTFSLALARSAIIDVTVDDDLNLFALALLSGRPHVMSCSLFTQGKKRWIHRFTEHFAPASLSCISAGQSLVALGSKDGQIHVYESSNEFKCLRLVTILAHHTGAIHTVIFHDGKLLSGSDDMSVGIVNITGEDSSKSRLILSKLLQGHVSRVRALDCQSDKVLSGSDDRSVKLWSIETGSPTTPVCTLTGHSGPVTGVLLALPMALSAAGCTVRVWDVPTKTCLKLLQHSDSPVTAMSWISTFRGVATVDSDNILRTFRLDNLETLREEIVSASTKRIIEAGAWENKNSSSPSSALTKTHQNKNSLPGINSEHPGASQSNNKTSLMTYSPKQSLKFYGSRDPRLASAWPDNAILKLESIPHHFTAFSIRNCSRQPCITLHCLDYVTMPATSLSSE